MKAAGRYLDALIAEKVMGLESLQLLDPKVAGYVYPDDVWPHIPDYSTDIAAAWEVVEKLTTSVYTSIELEPVAHYKEYTAAISFEVDDGDAVTIAGPFYFTASSMPHAICLAALKAVGAT